MEDQQMQVEHRLDQLGIELPIAPSPVANFQNGVVTGSLVYVSGQGPIVGGVPAYLGAVGGEVSEEEGYDAARICAINGLAVLKATVGDLDRVARVVKLLGFVASAPGYHRQPFVVDGASDFLAEVFGDRGRHARSAIGTSILPFNIPVEIEFMFELR
jgi:enamine deaminase RidA (YjgF/YER057c/UK114 family)